MITKQIFHFDALSDAEKAVISVTYLLLADKDVSEDVIEQAILALINDIDLLGGGLKRLNIDVDEPMFDTELSEIEYSANLSLLIMAVRTLISYKKHDLKLIGWIGDSLVTSYKKEIEVKPLPQLEYKGK